MPLPRSRWFTRPKAIGVCDRCGQWRYHSDLRWQYDYRGIELMNTRFLVCERCEDIPRDQARPVILPPDPVPIENPRVEPFAADENAP